MPVHTQSLIELHPLPLPEIPSDIEVLFFVSPQSVKQFFAQFPDVKQAIAVLGPGTAAALPPDIRPAFTGKGSTPMVAKQFKRFLGKRKAGMVGGRQSRKSIQKALPESQYIDLTIYDTRPAPAKLPDFDAYIFTSPSNVTSFFINNALPGGCRVVAIGTPTSTELKKHGVQARVALAYTPNALWSAIFSALHS